MDAFWLGVACGLAAGSALTMALVAVVICAAITRTGGTDGSRW